MRRKRLIKNNSMLKYFGKLLFLLVVMLTASAVFAQGEASTSNGRPPRKEDLPKNIKETLEKGRIEREKKDHNEMLKNGEEALKLSEELEKSVAENNNLNSDDRKKLERLEKILKKIRKELGGDDDGNEELNVEATSVNEEKPSSIMGAIKKLQNTASNLLGELKKTSRFSISAAAIQSSNAFLKLVKFLRFTR